MNSTPLRFVRGALLVALTSTFVISAVQAHGNLEPVDDLQSHIGDYEKEISSMNDTVAAIVADYESGESVTDRVDSLVDTWENVEFHEAVETNAMALYPPIWIALGGLREAVEEPNADSDVEQWQQRVNHALHEGLGALKLAATRDTSSPALAAQDEGNAAAAAHTGADADDDRPAIAVIKENLDRVVDEYRDGDTTAANQLLQQTYMQRFEGIEGALIEHDADLVTDLEKDFNGTLPLLMEKKASANEISAHVEKMNAKLDRAQTLLDQSAKSESSVF